MTDERYILIPVCGGGMGKLGVNKLEQREERGKGGWEMGDVDQILLVVILHQTDSMNTLGNDPLILSQHLAGCTHTIVKGDVFERHG